MKFLLFTVILTVTSVAAVDAAPKNKAVVVKVGQEKVVLGTGIKVKFIEVLEDARCPADVTCVWAGNAKIKLQLTKAGKSETVELNTALDPKEVKFAGYSFKIAQLLPYPRSNVRINRLGYVARLQATPAGR